MKYKPYMFILASNITQVYMIKDYILQSIHGNSLGHIPLLKELPYVKELDQEDFNPRLMIWLKKPEQLQGRSLTNASIFSVSRYYNNKFITRDMHVWLYASANYMPIFWIDLDAWIERGYKP